MAITILRPRGGLGYKLLKTGQTTQYGGMLDDGFYQAGKAKSYTVLSTGQYSGTTNVTINAKTDVKSNNCVLDNNTGLMWSRYVSASVGPNSNGTLPWTTNGNGEGIFTYCTAANAATLAGFADWRIANMNELQSIGRFGNFNGLPDPTAFPLFPNAGKIVWSSTYSPFWGADRAEALGINSTAAVHHWQGQPATNNYYCALVRGGLS